MKNDIEILRCLLQLNIPWQNELTESNDLKKKEIIKNGLLVIDKIIKDSDLKHEEIDILNDALINKHEKMEKVGNKYYYSDSGIRNKTNIILKNCLNRQIKCSYKGDINQISLFIVGNIYKYIQLKYI